MGTRSRRGISGVTILIALILALFAVLAMTVAFTGELDTTRSVLDDIVSESTNKTQGAQDNSDISPPGTDSEDSGS